MFFTKLEVGEQFPAKINGEVGMTLAGGPTLILNWRNIKAKEVREVKSGLPRFRLYRRDGIIFVLFKFGTLPWMDTAYTVHLEESPVQLENIADGQGYGLQVYLVDADTNTIKAMRLISLEADLSHAFREAVIDQQSRSFDKYIYYMSINNIYNVMSTEDIVRAVDAGGKAWLTLTD